MRCQWCREQSSRPARADAKFCSKKCRQASWRFGVGVAQVVAEDQPRRFAYADPPYPGLSGYYPERQEVDHASLIDRLDAYDGWALSTSAAALPFVLSLLQGRRVRVCAWMKNPRGGSGWEPLLVSGFRRSGIRESDCLRYGGRYRAFPGAMIGMKPPQFSEWMFRLLGAGRGDTLDDLYPGSGAVSLAWLRYVSPEASNDATSPALRDVSRSAVRD